MGRGTPNPIGVVGKIILTPPSYPCMTMKNQDLSGGTNVLHDNTGAGGPSSPVDPNYGGVPTFGRECVHVLDPDISPHRRVTLCESDVIGMNAVVGTSGDFDGETPVCDACASELEDDG